MTSTRLPGKVLMEAGGKPMLQILIERLSRVPQLDDIIVATTVNATDDPVAALADTMGVKHYRGSEHDVLGRVLEAAQAHDVDIIVEMTGDNPLLDPGISSTVIDDFLRGGADYVSNTLAPRSYPIGMDTQVFRTKTLQDVASRTNAPDDREHVSLYMYSNPDTYRIRTVQASGSHRAPDARLTLDTAEDYERIRTIYEALAPENPEFGLTDILDFLKRGRSEAAALTDVGQ